MLNGPAAPDSKGGVLSRIGPCHFRSHLGRDKLSLTLKTGQISSRTQSRDVTRDPNFGWTCLKYEELGCSQGDNNRHFLVIQEDVKFK